MYLGMHDISVLNQLPILLKLQAAFSGVQSFKAFKQIHIKDIKFYLASI